MQRYNEKTLEKRREYCRNYYKTHKNYFKNHNEQLKLKLTPEKKKEYNQRYYNKHKAVILKNQKSYQVKTITRRKAWLSEYNSKPDVKAHQIQKSREWRNKNRTHYREYRRSSKIRNYMREYGREYAKNNPEKYLGYRKKSLTTLGSNFNLDTWDYLSAINHWSNVVKNRDKHCLVCGAENKLHAHHILEKHLYPKLSLNTNNGVTLCEKHHWEVHGRNLINFS